MGTDGWDDNSWRRGGTPRSRRAPDGGQPDRSNGRGLRESARGADGWDRPRGSRNDAGAPGSRYGRRPQGGDDDWGDARGSSGYGGRGRQAGAGGSARGGSRAPREDYEDDYRSRGRGMPADRSMRTRAAARPDAWDAPQQRSRRPAGQGGLWDDQDRPRRARPGGSDPSGRNPAGRYGPRDPRARRAAAKKSGGISFGTAFGIVVLMFVLGGAAAFGVFTLTKPQVKADSVASPAPTVPSTASPATTPSASPQATPTKTGSRSGGPSVVFVIKSALAA